MSPSDRIRRLLAIAQLDRLFTIHDDLNAALAESETRDPCYTDPVSNLTLSIDDETLKRARIRALEQGTSVNAVVRHFLESYAGMEDERRALARFLEVAEHSGAGAEGGGRAWSRAEIYDEVAR